MPRHFVGPLELTKDLAGVEKDVRSLLSEVGDKSKLVGIVDKNGTFYLADSLTFEEMQKLQSHASQPSVSRKGIQEIDSLPAVSVSPLSRYKIVEYSVPRWIPFGVIPNEQHARETYLINVKEESKKVEQIESILNRCQALNNNATEALSQQPKQPEEKSEKPKVMLFVDVYKDGTGDFTHFVDFYRKFKKEKDESYEFIPVIACAIEQLPKIKPQLDALIEEFKKPKHYFFKYQDEIYESKTVTTHPRKEDFTEAKQVLEDAELKKDLREAQQVVLISHSWFPCLADFEKQMNYAAPLKIFGEHEEPLYNDIELEKKGVTGLKKKELQNFALPNLALQDYLNRNGWESYSMGLFLATSRGIKFKENFSALATEEVLAAMQKANSTFLNALLNHSGAGITIETFKQDNTLIPAYFNKIGSFVGFLHLLAMHPNVAKNPSIYFSGCEIKESDLKALQNTNIQQIVIIKPGQEDKIIDCNSSGTQVVRIYSGFNLENNLYEKLYRQASLVGVSGDNTFEMAISTQKAFPYYLSTNYGAKPTLLGLAENIIPRVELPKDVRDDYLFYFKTLHKLHMEPEKLLATLLNEYEDEIRYDNPYATQRLPLKQKPTKEFAILYQKQLLEKYKELNLEKMLEHWPRVANYIFVNHNYYDKLPEIFLADVPKLRNDNPAVLPKLDVASTASDVKKEEVTIPPSPLPKKEKISVSQIGIFAHQKKPEIKKEKIVDSRKAFIADAQKVNLVMTDNLYSRTPGLLQELQVQMRDVQKMKPYKNQLKELRLQLNTLLRFVKENDFPMIVTYLKKIDLYFDAINKHCPAKDLDLIMQIAKKIDDIQQKNSPLGASQIAILVATQEYVVNRDLKNLASVIHANPGFDHQSFSFGRAHEVKRLVNQAVGDDKKILWETVNQQEKENPIKPTFKR